MHVAAMCEFGFFHCIWVSDCWNCNGSKVVASYICLLCSD